MLLKLSSTLKLRNFDIGMKMMAVAPHRWFVQPLVASYITFGVGYCFIHSKGNAKTRVWDKAVSSHTLFFIRFHLGIGKHNTSITMKFTDLEKATILSGLSRLICVDNNIAKAPNLL